MFDAKAYLASLERPTFKDVDDEGNEITFTGELVSFNTVLPFVDLLANVEAMDETEVRALVPQIVDAIKMAPEAGERINRLPIAGVLECIADFFLCLKGARKKAP